MTANEPVLGATPEVLVVVPVTPGEAKSLALALTSAAVVAWEFVPAVTIEVVIVDEIRPSSG